jgi:hypothetical protein
MSPHKGLVELTKNPLHKESIRVGISFIKTTGTRCDLSTLGEAPYMAPQLPGSLGRAT